MNIGKLPRLKMQINLAGYYLCEWFNQYHSLLNGGSEIVAKINDLTPLILKMSLYIFLHQPIGILAAFSTAGADFGHFL